MKYHVREIPNATPVRFDVLVNGTLTMTGVSYADAIKKVAGMATPADEITESAPGFPAKKQALAAYIEMAGFINHITQNPQ